jgi:hypothetical protein
MVALFPPSAAATLTASTTAPMGLAGAGSGMPKMTHLMTMTMTKMLTMTRQMGCNHKAAVMLVSCVHAVAPQVLHNQGP